LKELKIISNVQQAKQVIDIKEEFYKMQKEGINNPKISQLSESIY